MNRRKVLKGLTAATAGSLGLVFGSGAFTTTEAERDFSVGLADSDAGSQLVIEENDDFSSSAVTTTDDGAFEIDASGVTPGATTTFGRFNNISDPTTLTEGVFVVRNENETGTDIDITVEITLQNSPNSDISLALLAPDDETVTDDEGDTVSGTVESVPSTVGSDTSDADAEVEVGFILDADIADEQLTADLTVTGERSGAE